MNNSQEMPEFDFARINRLYMAGSHVFDIEPGSYKEFQIEGKKETFVATVFEVVDKHTIVGASDDIIAMRFGN